MALSSQSHHDDARQESDIDQVLKPVAIFAFETL